MLHCNLLLLVRCSPKFSRHYIAVCKYHIYLAKCKLCSFIKLRVSDFSSHLFIRESRCNGPVVASLFWCRLNLFYLFLTLFLNLGSVLLNKCDGFPRRGVIEFVPLAAWSFLFCGTRRYTRLFYSLRKFFKSVHLCVLGILLTSTINTVLHVTFERSLWCSHVRLNPRHLAFTFHFNPVFWCPWTDFSLVPTPGYFNGDSFGLVWSSRNADNPFDVSHRRVRSAWSETGLR